jgi:hypothetical protein
MDATTTPSSPTPNTKMFFDDLLSMVEKSHAEFIEQWDRLRKLKQSEAVTQPRRPGSPRSALRRAGR